MLLRHGLGFGPEAEAVERAIEDALVAGRTADIAGPDKKVRSCSAMTRAIVERVQAVRFRPISSCLSLACRLPYGTW